MRMVNLIALGLVLVALILLGFGCILAWELETEGAEEYYNLKRRLSPDEQEQYTNMTRAALISVLGLPGGVLVAIAIVLGKLLGSTQNAKIKDDGIRQPIQEEILQTIIGRVIQNHLDCRSRNYTERQRPIQEDVGKLDASRHMRLRRFLESTGCQDEMDPSFLGNAATTPSLPSRGRMWLGRVVGLSSLFTGGCFLLLILAMFIVESITQGLQRAGFLPPIGGNYTVSLEIFLVILPMATGLGLLYLARIETHLLETWRVSRRRVETVARVACRQYLALMRTHLCEKNSLFCQGAAAGLLEASRDGIDPSALDAWLVNYPDLLGDLKNTTFLDPQVEENWLRWRSTDEGAANWNLGLELITLAMFFISLILVETAIQMSLMAVGTEIYGILEDYGDLQRAFLASGGFRFAIFCFLAPFWLVFCGIYGIHFLVLPEDGGGLGDLG